MRWTSLFSRRPSKIARPANKPSILRPQLEGLEDRVVPANTPANLLNGIRDTVNGFVDGLVSQVLQGAQTVLPVINAPLGDLSDDVQTAGAGVTTRINQSLNPTNPTLDELRLRLNPVIPDEAARAQAATAIASALAPYAQNVRVTDLRPLAGVAVVEMDLVVPLVAQSFPLGTALPVLPVQLGNGVIVLTSNVRYEGLRVELQSDRFAFRANTARTDELQLTLDAGLPAGASFTADIGFLRGTAVVNPAGVGLHK